MLGLHNLPLTFWNGLVQLTFFWNCLLSIWGYQDENLNSQPHRIWSVTVLLAQWVALWIERPGLDSQTVQVTFVVIYQEINSTAIPINCSSPLICTYFISFLRKANGKALVLVSCLTAGPGLMQWLNCTRSDFTLSTDSIKFSCNFVLIHGSEGLHFDHSKLPPAPPQCLVNYWPDCTDVPTGLPLYCWQSLNNLSVL
jgi:hypothetical protein